MKSVRFVLALVAIASLAYAGNNAQPPNDLPNGYRTIRDWAQPPGGVPWAAVTAVEVAPNGDVYVIHRCHENSCVGRTEPPILKFDHIGKLLKAWGEGMFNFPHGATIDPDGNLWVTDELVGNGKGDQVFKFSPDGKVLMTLGKTGQGAGSAALDTFDQPTGVAVASNGDIFVAEGHAPKFGNSRIVKFDKGGKFIKTFAKLGSGDGELKEPHAIALDRQDRLFVADRNNGRVVIFDQDGKFIAAWKQFGRPSGLWVDQNDMLYTVDSQSSNDPKSPNYNGGCKMGIRVGSVKDGKVTAYIPPPPVSDPKLQPPEGIAVDSHGTIYAAAQQQSDVKKYVKN
jgi:sugar lactone lactonase YvrE